MELHAIELGKRELGKAHPSRLTSLANLASRLWNQWRWKEAEELDMQVAKTGKSVLGKKHPSVLNSIGNLASTF